MGAESNSRKHSRSCRHYIGNVLEELPSRVICDELYQLFYGGIHPLIPLVHIPTFDSHYRNFWDWYDGWNGEDAPEGILATTPSFLPLLFAVLFSGTFTCPTQEDDPLISPDEAEELQSRLYAVTLNALALVGFPQNPAIYSLMGYLLTQNLLIREEDSLSSSSFVAIAFRISQAMGIHRDGTHFNLDPVQIEERRRIWWHLMHVDVMTSIISGLPPINQSDAFHDTRILSELKDEHVGKLRDDNSSNDNFWLYPGYVLAAGRYDASSVIRNILRRQFTLQPMTQADIHSLKTSIEKLAARTDDRLQKLSGLFQREKQAQEAELLTRCPIKAFEAWASQLLQLMVDRAYCLLYQALMRDEGVWKDLRSEAIPKFQSMTRIFVEMCNTQPYRPFQWLYPGSYQPLQPTAVLLIDLMRNPKSPEAKKSRALLEMIFSLLGPEGRMTVASDRLGGVKHRNVPSRAKEAWARLDRLRKKVWKALGLESSVMWSRSISPPQKASNGMADQQAEQMGVQSSSFMNGVTFPVEQTGLFSMTPFHGFARYASNMNNNINVSPVLTSDSDPSSSAFDSPFSAPQLGTFTGDMQQDPAVLGNVPTDPFSAPGLLNQESLDELAASIPLANTTDWLGWDAMNGGFL